jgi:predicted enzyme related to lactoylglutathione lyase
MQNHVDTWWHELNTRDPLEARNFYRRTLGWSFEKVTMPDGEPYWLARKAGRTIGGLYKLSAPKFDGIPAHWMTYMAVDDVSRALKSATSAGGEICRPVTEIPGIGLIAIVTDASGALIGLIEPYTGDQLDTHDSQSSDEMETIEPELVGANTPAPRQPAMAS